MATVDFTGEYEHRLDDRGRLAIPSAYRGLFEHGGYLLPGPEGQLELYTPEAYQAEKQIRTVNDKLRPAARRLARSFFGRVRRVETDRQGRILIPPQASISRSGTQSRGTRNKRKSTSHTGNCYRRLPTASSHRATARGRHDVLLNPQSGHA